MPATILVLVKFLVGSRTDANEEGKTDATKASSGVAGAVSTLALALARGVNWFVVNWKMGSGVTVVGEPSPVPRWRAGIHSSLSSM